MSESRQGQKVGIGLYGVSSETTLVQGKDGRYSEPISETNSSRVAGFFVISTEKDLKSNVTTKTFNINLGAAVGIAIGLVGEVNFPIYKKVTNE